MRVLVCGGRDYDDYSSLATLLSALQVTRKPFTAIIHGAAKGADYLADTYMNTLSQTCRVMVSLGAANER